MSQRGVILKQIRWMLALLLVGLFVPGLWASGQGGKPDLLIKGVDLQPSSLRAGDTLTVRAEIANGNRFDDVDKQFEVSFRINGVRISSRLVRFAILQKATLKFTWPAVAGSHTLRIEVDRPRNQIIESNERNNVREITFIVEPDSNVKSFTHIALSAQASAWEQAGMVLTFNASSTDLFLLLGLLKEGFNGVAKAMNSVVVRLNGLNEVSLPGAFAKYDFFTPLFAPYSAINNAAALVQQSLDRFDLSAAITAMGNIEAALRQLALQDNPVQPLSQLEQAADALALAIEAASETQVRFGDSSRGPVDESIATLTAEMTAFGEILSKVAQALGESAQSNTVQFLDANGQSVRKLNGSIDVNISAPGAPLSFELIDRNGTSVLTLNSATNTLNWKGTNAQGQRLSAQTYFYRVQWQGNTLQGTDIGILTITD